MKRHHWIALALLLLSTTVGAEPARPQLSSRLCSYSTPYDLRVGNDGVWLERSAGLPREVHIHEGGISIDQRAQEVSAADGLRLRRMEAMTRELVPAVAGVARDAVDIAFDALAGVVQVLSGSPAKARDVERFRRRAQAQIDDSLGRGRWDQKAFDAKFEANVERAAEDMAASLTRHVLWAVFSGRAEDMDRRAEQMEKELDARMEQRSRALEDRAQSLCTQVAALHQVQQELELRYRGQPLQLLVPSPGSAQDSGNEIAANGR